MGCPSPFDPGLPRQVIGHHIDRDGKQHQEKANPKQPRMMQTPPVNASGLLRSSVMASTLVYIHFLSFSLLRSAKAATEGHAKKTLVKPDKRSRPKDKPSRGKRMFLLPVNRTKMFHVKHFGTIQTAGNEFRLVGFRRVIAALFRSRAKLRPDSSPRR